MFGRAVTLVGHPVRIGRKAPDFNTVAGDLSTVMFSSLLDRPCVIGSIVSLDVSACAAQARCLGRLAAHMQGLLRVLVVSMDLPFAQVRWCGTADVRDLMVLSDYRDASFGAAYGLLARELRLLARAVLLVDGDGVLRYMRMIENGTSTPQYDGLLDAARRWL